MEKRKQLSEAAEWIAILGQIGLSGTAAALCHTKYNGSYQLFNQLRHDPTLDNTYFIRLFAIYGLRYCYYFYQQNKNNKFFVKINLIIKGAW